MSYTMMCEKCPDHAFLEAAGEQLFHVGIGYESDGSRAHDAARRDADHRPVPIEVDSEQAQRAMLDRVLAQVRKAYPMAHSLHLETSDQSVGYGFWIRAVTQADGTDLATDGEVALLADAVSGELADLNWSERGGLIEESDTGFAVVRL